MNHLLRFDRWFVPVSMLVLQGLACNLAGQAAPKLTEVPQPASPTAMPPTEAPAATATVKALPAATSTAEPTQTSARQGILLAASGGNRNIRRGPGQGYDVVGFLLDTQPSPAIGRDEPASWLHIAIPDRLGTSGWVSVDSRYASIAPGADAVQSLPTLAMDPAKPADLRNCTFHPMKVNPGGLILKPQTDSPDNQVQVNPGTYSALDQSVAEAEARTLTVKEGQDKDITTDGLDNPCACS